MQSNTEIGYGKRLRLAREAAGLSPLAVAERLRLSTDTVLSLEQEKLQQTLAPAFIRGYIRAYSQLVAEKTEELVNLYNRHAGDDPELVQITHTGALQRDNSTIVRGGVITVVVILVIVAGFWSYEYLQIQKTAQPEVQSAVPAAAATEPEVSSDPMIDQALDKIATEQAAQYSEQTSEIDQIVGLVAERQNESSEPLKVTESKQTNAAVTVTVLDEAASNQSLQSEVTNEVVSLAPQGGDRLQLSFSGPSWIEAVDANGYRLIYGLFDETDRQLIVRGKAPFKIIVGDTKHVEIKVNDTRHELRAYTRPNNTARVLFGEGDRQ